jgi:hypothetical protein
LVGIPDGEGQIRLDLGLDSNGRADRGLEQASESLDEGGEVHRHTLKGLTACEGKQTLHENSGALGGLEGAIDQTPIALITQAASL